VASNNFIDHVRLYCRSGAGGAGSVHFRREKSEEKGGPDGGDGGRGGHIILRGNRNMWTLLHLRYTKHMFADDGNAGEGGKRSGSQGNDLIIDVPLGTIAKHGETGDRIAEVVEDGQEIVLLEGGKGGYGNTHFKSPTRQSPVYAQPGIEGIEQLIILELKVLADVGLVGFPNAGKSTLLSVVSAATPEIGDYPFTTLRPNLGVVAYRDSQSFVIADIPGIIEGASEGKGLGLRFLRHIERNSILLFMIPADTEDIMKEYKILLNELQKYNPELLDKDRILAISKSDMLDQELEEAISEEIGDIPHIFISSITQKNLTQLKDLIWKSLTQYD